MASNPGETQELLNQAEQGKPDAVDQLLTRQREPLRRMIDLRLDRRVSARVDASDVVQEVLLEASRRLRDYLKNPVMPFHLWLRHIAEDHIIDTHRRHHQAQKRNVEREQPLVRPSLAGKSSVELAGQLLDPEQTPASAALQHELQLQLDAAIEALHEDDRDIILMRHFEQLSNQEIAEYLGLTEAAASMRYLRAIRKLKAGLAPG
jgi:RNA polymerase sigma-70 factor (ECF subfamily)